jgi:hypothetical protein
MPAKFGLGAVVAAILLFGAAAAPTVNAAPADDACSLLTQAQVGAVLGVAVGAGSYQSPTFKRTCTWNTASNAQSGAKYVTLIVEGPDAYLAGKKTGAMKANSIKVVSGVGNDAYYQTVSSNVGLNVKKGNAAFKVAVYGDLPIEKKQAMEKTLAQQVLARL